MRKNKALNKLLTFSILITLFVTTWQPAYACECLFLPENLAKEFNNAKAVFQGKTIDYDILQDVPHIGPIVETFEISRAWKGVDSQFVRVNVGTNNVFCRYDTGLKPNTEYIVFATESDFDPGILFTSHCDSTSNINDATNTIAFLETMPTIPIESNFFSLAKFYVLFLSSPLLLVISTYIYKKNNRKTRKLL